MRHFTRRMAGLASWNYFGAEIWDFSHQSKSNPKTRLMADLFDWIWF
jgi:hypothetical protein